MAGAPKSIYENLNIPAFIQQAEEFNDIRKNVMNNVIEKLSVMDNAMPWMVNRAAKLLEWYHSGEYTKIIQKYGM